MKNTLSVIAVCILISASLSCRQFNSLGDLLPGSKASAQGISSFSGMEKEQNSQPIPLDTANRMIMSYLSSIEYKTHPKTIRSWAFNADTLRHYLSTEKGKKIVMLKLMIAHTTTYINAGHYGQTPSPLDNNHALTVVIAGVDSLGHYVFNNEDMVYDQCLPCPENCVGDSATFQ